MFVRRVRDTDPSVLPTNLVQLIHVPFNSFVMAL